MMDQLKYINMSEKKLVSFDVKFLFTYAPVEGALEAIHEVVDPPTNPSIAQISIVGVDLSVHTL